MKKKKIQDLVESVVIENGVKVTKYKYIAPKYSQGTFYSKGAIFNQGHQRSKFGRSGKNMTVEEGIS